jgi:hypothetical protein
VVVAESPEGLRLRLAEPESKNLRPSLGEKDAAPSAQGSTKQAKGDLDRSTENRQVKPMPRPTLDKPDAETTPAARASSFYVRPDRKDI